MEETALVFSPLPGAGHLVSSVELAKRLLEKQQCFSITVLLMHPRLPSTKSAITSSTTSYVQSVALSNPSIHFVDLPLVDFAYQNNQNLMTFISLFIDMHKSHVKEAIKRISSSSSSLPTRIAAMIMDFFSTTMIDVGKELGIPTYIYVPSGAALLGLMLYVPTLDVKIPCEFKDYQGDVEVPGMLPMPPLVMPEPFMDKKTDAYGHFVSHGRRFRETDGLIVNTFAELEPTELKSVT
ncbi:hypothetical protein MRB53_007197 [Persea americana]|uniref:Uncharacterized protein n=1 Tax=Persea americana TaxID=3435 RepID=A0ACC2MJD2_PERAE|nr:hypothetical protein MRB53_007197 [Persea americana]